VVGYLADVWGTETCQISDYGRVLEVNKPKFLANCGAFDRYLNEAPSGVLALPAYERVSGYPPDI
jgi:hypothetical protein